MNLLAQILLACLIIAALQGILPVLAVGVALALVVGLIWRPGETIPLLLFLLLLEALDRWPLATVAASMALFGAFLIASPAKRAASCRRLSKKARTQLGSTALNSVAEQFDVDARRIDPRSLRR